MTDGTIMWMCAGAIGGCIAGNILAWSLILWWEYRHG